MVLKHYQHVKNAQEVAAMEQMPHIVFGGGFCMSKKPFLYVQMSGRRDRAFS